MRFPPVNPGLCRFAPFFLWLGSGLAGVVHAAPPAPVPASNPAVRTAPAVAPEELALTLRAAVRMALARNYAIQAEKYAPAIARARVTQALGAFDPTLVARAQRSQNNNPALVTTPGGNTGIDSARTVDEDFDFHVQGLTPWGGVVSVGTSVEDNYGDAANNGDDDRRVYSSFVGVTATQPLLRDGGREATLAPIRLARKDAQTSDWSFRQTVIDIITETAQAYDDLYFARESLAVAMRSRDLAARLVKDNQSKVQLGVMTPLDISVARAQYAAREEAIITARQTMHEAENALKLRVCDDIERFLSIRLVIAPPEDRDSGVMDFNADLPHAFSNRPDYQQALLDIQRRQISLVFDRNQARPRLDLSASLGSNGLDRRIGESLAQAYRGDNIAFSAGVNLTLPIPNRTGRGAVEASRLQVAQALVTLKQLEQQVIVRLDNAAGQVRTGRASIVATAEALRLARESLAAEETKLTQGTSTTYVVLQLQNDLTAAENNLLRARTDYRKALVEYDRQSGRTLERNRVELTFQ